MKAYGGVDVYIHVFLTSALAEGEWSAPGTHWIEGWVDPRSGLDDVVKRKFLTLPVLELDPSVVQPVASHYTDCAIPAPHTSLGQKKNIGCRSRRDLKPGMTV
jgi:hypothetical protein